MSRRIALVSLASWVSLSFASTGCELVDTFEGWTPHEGGVAGYAGGGNAASQNKGGNASTGSSRSGGSSNIGGTSSVGAGGVLGGNAAGGGTLANNSGGANVTSESPSFGGENFGGAPATAGGSASIGLGGAVTSGQGGGAIGGMGTKTNMGGTSTGAGGSNWNAGTVSTGGKVPTAGRSGSSTTTAAGTPSVGGSTSTGGVATGGVATGGVATGGVATGGVATGGVATGGVATGGVATGGVATGGVATGGVATGGAPVATTVNRECPTTALSCHGESCCTTIKLPGGSFKMGRSTVAGTGDYYQPAELNGGVELPEHDTTVASFGLDKYEVTVGRFRAFLSRYDTWHKALPANPRLGAGANPNVEASTAAATGWGMSWTLTGTELPAGGDELRTQLNSDAGNWTDYTSDGREAYPINYVTWYLAFAFCIWDGGRLPTEAEWEFAAAAGSENRVFPWIGSTIDATRANYGSSRSSPAVDVGSYPAGVGAFGHMDLAGSMYEWVLDSYSYPYYGSGVASSCNNCAFFTAGSDRMIRGGGWGSSAIDLRAASRSPADVTLRVGDHGFRCARDL